MNMMQTCNMMRVVEGIDPSWLIMKTGMDIGHGFGLANGGGDTTQVGRRQAQLSAQHTLRVLQMIYGRRTSQLFLL
jgi:hypothetical protein